MENCHILVSGRWDNVVSVVDFRRALDPSNDGTPKAIINRIRVTHGHATSALVVEGNAQPHKFA